MARVAVIGNSGTGKSWGAGAIIERVLDTSHPENPGSTFDLAVHFDFEDEEKGLSDAANDPLLQRLDVTPDLAERIDWLKLLYNHRRLRVVPDMTQEEAKELLGVISKAMMKLCKDVVPELTGFLSIDEAHNFIPQGNNDQRVHRLISGGRKHGVEFLVISQRPVSLHTSALGLADRRIYFRVDEKNDIRGLREVTTFNADILQNLKDRECVVENKSSGEHVRETTNNWNRIRPHYAKDDGIVDDALPV